MRRVDQKKHFTSFSMDHKKMYDMVTFIIKLTRVLASMVQFREFNLLFSQLTRITRLFGIILSWHIPLFYINQHQFEVKISS